MNCADLETKITIKNNVITQYAYILKAFCAGLLITLGFAPFHLPGMAILGIASLFAQLQTKSFKKAAICGFVFGLSFMLSGISWIFVSISLYGNLNYFLAVIITIIFILYLSVFFVLQATAYWFLNPKHSKLGSMVIFSASWCLCEYLRANFASGFPWLLIGFGQVDSPLQYLLPYAGIYGVSFITCTIASLIYFATQTKINTWQRIPYLIIFLTLILTPLSLNSTKSIPNHSAAIKIGIIQANLSMRDKWDEQIFDKITNRYLTGIESLTQKAKLIVLPESAIPVPQIYAREFLKQIKKFNTSQVLIGIPKVSKYHDNLYYNTLTSINSVKQAYIKQHLVPFGEYIPKIFKKLTDALKIPDGSMLEGAPSQPLLQHNKHKFASLICFEIAYPEILRTQLPAGEWIVSVSDAGWFGHSLAIYQLLQMSQALSIMTERYQIVANNNGLSSIIDSKGKILSSLPAFSSMDLYGKIYSINTTTIWTRYGDKPYLYLCIVIIIIALLNKKSYPYRSTLQ